MKQYSVRSASVSHLGWMDRKRFSLSTKGLHLAAKNIIISLTALMFCFKELHSPLSSNANSANSLPDFLSGIQRAAQTVLGVYLKRTCSCVTSASSALGVLNDYALYKSTHAHTHSLCWTLYRYLSATYSYAELAVSLRRRRYRT